MRASGAPQNTIKYCCNGISTQFTARGAICTECLALLNLFISLSCNIRNQLFMGGLIHDSVRIPPKILKKQFCKENWAWLNLFKNFEVQGTYELNCLRQQPDLAV